LAVALVAPPVILISQAQNEFNTLIDEEIILNRSLAVTPLSLNKLVPSVGINHYHGELDKPKT
jgi:hypothetical protein